MNEATLPTGTVTVSAPAKLTLSLRVLGTRSDGYHLIDAEMVELELADRLTIDPRGHGIELVGPFATHIPANEDNLVSRALRFVARTAHVAINKQIPAGGGLGGGSADAASVLRWAGWTDVAGAAVLGADVPFCLVGGRARVTGIGELIEPLPRRDLDVTLVIPPFALSTPLVYRAWDTLNQPRGDGPNDLQRAAMTVEPRLGRFCDRLREAVGQQPILAGSGATWFVIGHHLDLKPAIPEATVVETRTAR